MALDLTNPFAKRPRQIAALPRVVRIYISSCMIGFVLAAAFSALLLTLDVGGLRHLIATVNGGGLAAFLLVFFNGIVFSGVQFGITLMFVNDAPPARPRRAARTLVQVRAVINARKPERPVGARPFQHSN